MSAPRTQADPNDPCGVEPLADEIARQRKCMKKASIMNCEYVRPEATEATDGDLQSFDICG